MHIEAIDETHDDDVEVRAAYARAEDRTRALRAGYQAHLAKPVEPAELLVTIASFAGLVDAQRRKRW